MNDYIIQTLDEMCDFYQTYKPNRIKHREGLTGIVGIRIEGQRLHNNILLDLFKQEARRLRFYLTIMVCPCDCACCCCATVTQNYKRVGDHFLSGEDDGKRKVY